MKDFVIKELSNLFGEFVLKGFSFHRSQGVIELNWELDDPTELLPLVGSMYHRIHAALSGLDSKIVVILNIEIPKTSCILTYFLSQPTVPVEALAAVGSDYAPGVDLELHWTCDRWCSIYDERVTIEPHTDEY